MASSLLINVLGNNVRELEPGSGVWHAVTKWESVLIPEGEAFNGETVEPMLGELPGASNNRIEVDAKAKCLAAHGIPITGAVHVWGGRTS